MLEKYNPEGKTDSYIKIVRDVNIPLSAISSVKLLSRVQLFATPRNAAC